MLPQLKITASKAAQCPLSASLFVSLSLSISFCTILPLPLSSSLSFPLSLSLCFGHLPSRIYRLNLIPTYVYVIFEAATLIERLKSNQQQSRAELSRAGQKLKISMSKITFGQPQAMRAKRGIFIYSNGNIIQSNRCKYFFFGLSYLCEVFLILSFSFSATNSSISKSYNAVARKCFERGAWRGNFSIKIAR